MKREIKFRYRYTDGKNWIFQSFTLEQIINGEPFEILSDNPMLKNYKYDGYNQYTGLKDKNCNEIYEGDILTYDERIRGFVKYIGCSFIIEWVGIDTYSDLLGWDNWRSGKTSDGSKYEIIGNIYQNPELLNQ